jgi:hypothetical protein
MTVRNGCFLASGLVAVVIAGTASAATHRLTIPHLREALIRQGYPARTQCGEVAEPPPPRTSNGGAVRMTSVPACWVIIERDGYAVSIIPHSSPAAAKVSYKSMQNRWAKRNRSAAVGYALISAFRLPKSDWARIYRLVTSVVTPSHP